MPGHAHALPPTDVLAQLGVASSEGLGEEVVRARRRQFGPNAVAARRAASGLRILLHQFNSPVVYLLAAAAALAFYFGELEQTAAIGAVLAINTLIGLTTEFKAARSIEALRALGGHMTRVRRAGRVRLIPAEQLVPGDIVLVDAGDAVSADLRLLEASALAVDESTLTGESVPVDKTVAAAADNARPSDRLCMLFKGTAVTRGSGVGVVVATGHATELGRVTQLVLDAQAGSSPLEKKLARLSGQLVWATLIVAAAIGGIGLIAHKNPLLMIEAAIALAVAAIPEGLPIVATLALARGMWRMARQNALIERLSAVETLGATTVVLTDKTGTLTENRMRARRLDLPSGGIDLEADGHSTTTDGQQIQMLLRIAVLCNDAHLDPAGSDGNGDPTEIALLRAGRNAGLTREALLHDHHLVRKHAFDPAIKMMATVHETRDGLLVAVKGAPEAVIAAATRVAAEHGTSDHPLDDAARADWLGRAERLARQGLRVLACAMKQAASANDGVYDELTLLGLIGLEDPARADVAEAIADCHRAGIRVVMVTGDHAVTARSIGLAVGIAAPDARVLEGRRIDELIKTDPAELRTIPIFARVSPAEKLALVKAYQAAGEIVAMTGDGVNDAPALRQADIGVAMGLRGTDVAREAAAMILLDDAFPSIIKAIRQGRIIFGNIRRFAAYLLSCNLSEVMVVGIAVTSALPLPVLPLQILYLNLVTDVFPAFALAMGEGEDGILRRPPRAPDEPILGRHQWHAIVWHGAALTAGTFAALFAAGRLALDARQTVTVTFLTLALAQLWHVFNMRGAQARGLRNEVTRNGWLWAALGLCILLLAAPPYLPAAANLLQVAPPTARMWGLILTCSAAPLVVIQTVSALARTRRARAR